MPPGPRVRVLLFKPDRPATRPAIDWIVERQRHARGSFRPLSGARSPAGSRPAPSRSSPADPTRRFRRPALGVLSARTRGAPGSSGGDDPRAAGGRRRHRRGHRDVPRSHPPVLLVMNLPSADGRPARTAPGIAGGARAWSDASGEALDAVSRRRPAAGARGTRPTPQGAQDGPDRFGRLAKKERRPAARRRLPRSPRRHPGGRRGVRGSAAPSRRTRALSLLSSPRRCSS